MHPLPPLDETTVGNDPIRLFLSWFEAALKTGGKEPSAMTLATVSPQGVPSARMVLLKGCEQRGFVFFTNYDSRKGSELAANPRAALVFYWPELNRQVRVVGSVVQISETDSDRYFETRPPGSRVAAAVSPQSQRLGSRAELEQSYQALSAKYPAGDVPRPKHWGGYCVQPDEIEFWHSRENRLHDRFRFRRCANSSSNAPPGGESCWQVERLAP